MISPFWVRKMNRDPVHSRHEGWETAKTNPVWRDLTRSQPNFAGASSVCTGLNRTCLSLFVIHRSWKEKDISLGMFNQYKGHSNREGNPESMDIKHGKILTLVSIYTSRWKHSIRSDVAQDHERKSQLIHPQNGQSLIHSIRHVLRYKYLEATFRF
jgi:hypothetical protein